MVYYYSVIGPYSGTRYQCRADLEADRIQGAGWEPAQYEIQDENGEWVNLLGTSPLYWPAVLALFGQRPRIDWLWDEYVHELKGY